MSGSAYVIETIEDTNIIPKTNTEATPKSADCGYTYINEINSPSIDVAMNAPFNGATLNFLFFMKNTSLIEIGVSLI